MLLGKFPVVVILARIVMNVTPVIVVFSGLAHYQWFLRPHLKLFVCLCAW